MPLLRPLAQRLSTERAQALHGRVLRFIAGVERAGAVFRGIEHRGHVFTQLRMALQPRHPIGNSRRPCAAPS